MSVFRTIRWEDGVVVTYDQSRLPHELVELRLRGSSQIAEAIQNMKIRGAPVIGVAAAFGLALTALSSKAVSKKELLGDLELSAHRLRSTRPTAVNLFWAIDRVLDTVRGGKGTVETLKKMTLDAALRLAEEDLQVNLAIGRNGASLLDDGDAVLTHCNAGGFGTVGYGTALGIVKAAAESGKRVRVIATETRPRLQGARLTTFELQRAGIPVTLIVDSAVGYVLAEGMVDKVIVGADRVLGDGSVINKIGTYTIAVLSSIHRIPFYVASPLSTVDLKTESKDVEIELRDEVEVLGFHGIRTAPTGIPALNPAFDVTPPQYVTAIVTESDVVFPPFGRSLGRLFSRR